MTLTPEQFGIIVGAILTLFILSYLLGDNFLFRFATHVLVGVGAAYITFTVFVDVLWERVVRPLVALQTLQTIKDPAMQTQVALYAFVAGVGIFFGFLLLFKFLPRWALIGNIPVGYLVGVGAAVALGGALFGTIGAQVSATALPPNGLLGGPYSDWANFGLNFLVGLGTITALLSFGFYRAARRGILSGINSIGRWFVSIALGATFALVYVASVTVLIDRVQAIVTAFGIITGSK
jgi:hypothetical protein